MVGKDVKDFKKKFQEWVESDLPDISEAHQFIDASDHAGICIVHPFYYKPPKSQILLPTEGTDASELQYRYYPLARVVYSSNGSIYSRGDFVRLKDADCAYITNPKYETWISNEYSNSNAQRVGNAPPAYINRFLMSFSRNMFFLNPLDADMNKELSTLYMLFDSNIVMTVTDPLWYLKSL